MTQGIGYNAIYQHRVPISGNDVPMKFVDWCGEHIKNKWGWHFESNLGLQRTHAPAPKAVMTFETSEDALWFSLNKAR